MGPPGPGHDPQSPEGAQAPAAPLPDQLAPAPTLAPRLTMPEFKDLPPDFCCPYREGCPYLEGLSTSWVWHRYQETGGLECTYESQMEELYRQVQEERRLRLQEHQEKEELRAQLRALHR